MHSQIFLDKAEYQEAENERLSNSLCGMQEPHVAKSRKRSRRERQCHFMVLKYILELKGGGGEHCCGG